ncbi:unnamed protein product [Adineta steineri]|uniref:G-protein coupled receptors family 1 profile domain-containing protein n=1 Tax=Adineta steineri TaxID=433720 RepID=A0A814LN50_9BILA|nr:unnamed protein product [Adineta steineri]CAF1068092.1 unnamed protein product [Adineta steineri]
MSSPAEVDFITSINNVSAQINRYLSIFIFLFGTVGNILNILVLSQRSFCLNSCATLFLSSSIANFIAIITGLTSRMLSGWAADLTNTNRTLCKLRAFVLNVARPMAFWLILLAGIDRWLLSSPNIRYRQMSSLKNAQRSIIIALILSILLFSHIIYCYEPNLINAPLKCYGVTIACRLATDLSLMFIVIFFPLLFMLVFGFMTIKNIRHSRDRTRPGDISMISMKWPTSTNRIHKQQRNKIDDHLLIMLFVQVLLLFIFALPLGVQKLYSTITTNRVSSQAQVAIDNFVYNFALLLNFVANGMPFYIYTLVGGNIFRKELQKMFATARQKICRL